MQLDALLASMSMHTSGLFTNLTVLYRPTSDRFEQAYAALVSDYAHVNWVREATFRDDLVGLIGEADMTVFHTDDDVYFRSPGPFEIRDDEVCFTLRLGLNTTYSYSFHVEQRLLGASVVGDRVAWDWRSQGKGDVSYPLAVNGHVFRTHAVESWLMRASYTNPNELEAALQMFNHEVEPQIASFRHSAIVSIPANVVNETHANRQGNFAHVEDLNDRFLAGERIDVSMMDFSSVRACHQEVPFVFRDV